MQDNAEFSAEIIRRVREAGGLSRVELARSLGVAASTIGRHVDAIIAAGYFSETREPTKAAGRPPTRLRPNAERGCFIGVDFHASHLYATLVNFAEGIVLQKGFPVDGAKGAEVVIEQVKMALADMQQNANMPVLAAGIASPGRVDTQKGMAMKYSFIPGYEDIPICQIMGGVVNVPIFLENNIRTMALAERWFGVAQGCQDLICFAVRYGVNAGVIRKGELASGKQELGGQIRSWNCPVYASESNSWTWSPNNKLEQFGNIPALLENYSKLKGQALGLKEFLRAASEGEAQALSALKQVASIHGWAVAQMVQLIDPELVVLAGPLTLLGDLYFDIVKATALEFESEYHPSLTIKGSELGEFAGAVGAAALALERWTPNDIAN